VKLAGIGQRMIRGGAHVGGVIVASGAERITQVLVPVYEALGLDWDPETSGAISGELDREVGLDEVEAALISELEKAYELTEVELDSETLELASGVLES
jgi:octanoyl-[GcvH]:protein N-octanoyltransferase